MLTYEEALRLARKHLEDEGPPAPGYRWQPPEGRRARGGWYFPYRYEKLGPAEPGGGIGGAPGYLVRDDGTVDVVGLIELDSILRVGTPPEPET
jgi:hypothetical protein